MRHLKGGGSAASHRSERSRIVALVTTFLFLLAGIVVSVPGLISVSASGSGSPSSTSESSDGHPNDDDRDDEDHDDGDGCRNDEGQDDDDATSTSVEDDDDATSTSVEDDDDATSISVEDDDDATSTSVEDDDDATSTSPQDSDDSNADETSTSVDNDGDDARCTITNDDVAPRLTVIKNVTNGDGGDAVAADFPLQVNGGPVTSGVAKFFAPGVALAITETQQAGYVASNVTCVSGDTGSYNNLSVMNPTGALASVTLALGEAVVCTITNDDIAPTVRLHKTVVGGTKSAADFHLTLAGQPAAQDTPIPTRANQPIVVSEDVDPDYVLTSIVCVELPSNTPLAHPLTLQLAQNASCTATNSLNRANITIVKVVINNSGGTLAPRDFQLKIDGVDVSQGAPGHSVPSGVHTISELARPGYASTSVVCPGITVGLEGSITLVAGQEVTCTVTNNDIPASITVNKTVINNDGGSATPSDFQINIDGYAVTQGAPTPASAGTHTITEDLVAGYRMVAIVCTDDSTGQALAYNGGIVLALGQHATCVVTNDDDPIDLSITKSDDGLVKVAGGPAFDYTIEVDNLGPRDALLTEPITVTDQLPVVFDFVSFPPNCTATGQMLTCDLDPADLQLADPPVVFTVSVRARPDAASGVYTNLAFVGTAGDPPCVGEQCVPVCKSSDNVACESTKVTRQAGITIVKVDNVEGAVAPGAAFSYFLTVTNTGPSTLLSHLTVTDDLPAGLELVSVSAVAPWTCNTVDPVVCTYNSALQPNTAAAVITVNVRVSPTFLGASILNDATAIAIVDNPVPRAYATMVTATDDETTPVVRVSDLSIVKTVSQASAASGETFNWFLTITNNGPDTATNVVVNDTIPAQFQVISALGTGLNCTNTGNKVQCTAPALADGAVVSAVVQVTVLASAAPGVVTNTAVVASDPVDPVPANNTDSEPITVVAAASNPPAAAAAPPASASRPLVPAISPAPGISAVGPTLPRTGSTPLRGPLTMAGLLLGGGVIALAIARRRRGATA